MKTEQTRVDYKGDGNSKDTELGNSFEVKFSFDQSGLILLSRRKHCWRLNKWDESQNKTLEVLDKF